MITDCKHHLTDCYRDAKLTVKSIHNSATELKQLSIAAEKIEKVMSPIAFCLLCLFLFQTLLVTTLLLMGNIIFYKAFGTFIGITLFLKLCLIAVLGSQIHEKFLELKNIIASAPAIKENIFNETETTLNHIALSQMAGSLTKNIHMTALGSIKIRKSVVFSFICAFITYSVLLLQVLN
ncbi:hypothetical protein TNIN_141391 [Trichonephila inaurata madagascariensis]|uniref:Uncharacterized protein n=1 Tax=Trichonephila inaurata madagascariensis TaxID=2747483 RepID=A0A8X7C7T7_9ARAC|nr:hypothetical protein TNIN_141391 [Trichonephila inaurata madagascariensis]